MWGLAGRERRLEQQACTRGVATALLAAAVGAPWTLACLAVKILCTPCKAGGWAYGTRRTNLLHPAVPLSASDPSPTTDIADSADIANMADVAALPCAMSWPVPLPRLRRSPPLCMLHFQLPGSTRCGCSQHAALTPALSQNPNPC